MGDTEKYKPQLVMYRPNLRELPTVQLPEGYSCRTFQPGDEAAWGVHHLPILSMEE